MVQARKMLNTHPLMLEVMRQNAIAQRLLLRPLGNVRYIMLPYCITQDELAFIYRGIRIILDDL